MTPTVQDNSNYMIDKQISRNINDSLTVDGGKKIAVKKLNNKPMLGTTVRKTNNANPEELLPLAGDMDDQILLRRVLEE